ncbi:MAG: hypothetical protein EOP11_17495, partial [Proteobacteria bacterium]
MPTGPINFAADAIAGLLVKVLTPAAGTSVASTFLATGSCLTGTPVLVSGDANVASTPCASGLFSTAVTLPSGTGTRTIYFTQISSNGLTGSAALSVTLDQGPIFAILSPASGSSFQNGITITGTCEDALSIIVSGTGTVSSGTYTCSNGAFSIPLLYSANDGTKVITASQTNAGGQVTSITLSTIRASAPANPVLSISSPTANSIVGSSFLVSGACTAAYPVVISGDATGNTTSCSSGAFSATITPTAGDGAKVIRFTQTAVPGISGFVDLAVTVNTQGPTLTIASPAANSNFSTGYTLTGTCTNGLPITVAGTGTTSGGSYSCASSAYSIPIVYTANDEAKSVSISQTNALGYATTRTLSTNRVTPPATPVVAITSPAANATVGTTFTVTGTCSSNYSVVTSGNGTAAQAACSSGNFTASVTASAGDGVKNLTFTQTAAPGITGSANLQVTVTSAGPTLTLTGPANSSSAQVGITLAGACTNGLPITVSGSGTVSGGTYACSSGAYSIPVAYSDTDGAKSISVAQSNALGNTTTVTSNTTRNSDLWKTNPGLRYAPPTLVNPLEIGVATIAGRPGTGVYPTAVARGAYNSPTFDKT